MRADFSDLDHATRREFDFEEHVVRSILKHYGMPRTRFALLREQEEITGNRRLSLVRFHLRFPSFPVYLAVASVSYFDKDCTIRRLMTRFKHTKLLGAWERRKEEVVDGYRRRPFGLVLKWPRSDVSLVFHNASRPIQNGPVFEYRTQGAVYSLEPLRKVLHGLNWTPESHEREE